MHNFAHVPKIIGPKGDSLDASASGRVAPPQTTATRVVQPTDEIKEFKEETGIDVVQCASVDNREDLDGLAALIEACDMVVSTSNVTIHLAGALAKETWVLLPYVANFWWLLERTDSIWYPSLTLYRQQTLNDWDSVYESIRKDLEDKVSM